VTILNLQMEEVTALETQKKLKIVLLMVIGVTGQAGVAAAGRPALDSRQGIEAGNATILHLLMEEWAALVLRRKLNIVKLKGKRVQLLQLVLLLLLLQHQRVVTNSLRLSIAILTTVGLQFQSV